MITTYNTVADYTAAGKPTNESRVAKIVETDEIMVDGVNVLTHTPEMGDAVYHDGTNYMFIKGGDQLNVATLPHGLTAVGTVVGWKGDKVLVLDKTAGNQKWCDCVQFSITAISSGSITFSLAMEGAYGTPVAISVELTDSSNSYINATTASEIDAALNAAGNTGNVGYDKHKWWAYLSDATEQPVESGGTKIIVQNDASYDYRQYSISGVTGCTMALSVWGDMPVSSGVIRRNGVRSTWGNGNYARSYAYISESGATPTSNVAITSDTIVNKTSFDSSVYCADLRAYYGTYADYIETHMVRLPQEYGVFKLPDGHTLCAKYSNKTFTKKNGTTSYRYPAMRTAYSVSYSGVEGLEAGNFYLPDMYDAVMIMDDKHIAAQNATADKMGTTKVSNFTHRWFSQRYYSHSAWNFYGTSGALSTNNVGNSNPVQAAVLLDP